MDVKQLRVGNWLCGKNNKFFKVESIYNTWNENLVNIDASVEGMQGYESACISGINLDQCTPVLLTYDRLLMAGFECFHMNPRLETFYINRSTYYPFIIYETRDRRFCFNENLEVKDVHQLQNLFFAITGEELDIKL